MTMRDSYSRPMVGLLLLIPLLFNPTNAVRRTPSSIKQTVTDFPRHRILGKNVDDPESPDEHLVESLPYLSPEDFPTKHYAGHVSASSKKRKLFYWLFEPPQQQESAPLLIWLNGGPGCSSMDGLWLENGPFRLNHKNNQKGWAININPHSWHNLPTYALYIDQPVGTGLSFTTDNNYCGSDEAVNHDFYSWLINFLKLHKDLFLTEDGTRMNRKLFFSGESHAGHYIPSMMDYILTQNDDDPEIEIVLGGAAIGNGWVDPYHQYAATELGYANGFIGLAQADYFKDQEKKCQALIDKGVLNSGVCFNLLDNIINQSGGQGDGNTVSPYDINLWETGKRNFPKGHVDLEAYLGHVSKNTHKKVASPSMDDGISQKVLEAIHATQATDARQYYMECTDPPYDALSHQDAKGVVPEVIRILEHDSNIQMLFFNGMDDMMCNHARNELFLDKMEWKNQLRWIIEKRHAWDFTNKKGPSGYVKVFKNLGLLKILNSGHMVPMDVPEVAFRMMETFLVNIDGFVKTGRQDIGVGMQSLDNGAVCEECPECTEVNEEEEDIEEEEDNGEVENSRESGTIIPDNESKSNNLSASPDGVNVSFILVGVAMSLSLLVVVVAARKSMTRNTFDSTESDSMIAEEDDTEPAFTID